MNDTLNRQHAKQSARRFAAEPVRHTAFGDLPSVHDSRTEAAIIEAMKAQARRLPLRVSTLRELIAIAETYANDIKALDAFVGFDDDKGESVPELLLSAYLACEPVQMKEKP